jgi:hypothetical protein
LIRFDSPGVGIDEIVAPAIGWLQHWRPQV